jgi:hypothetical protein
VARPTPADAPVMTTPGTVRSMNRLPRRLDNGPFGAVFRIGTIGCLSRSSVMTIGRRTWAIADNYIPGSSHGPAPQMTSHEAVCLLNAGDKEAHVTIVLYFADRDPVGPYRFTVGARRTKHIRYNELKDPAAVPRETPYASVIESDEPIIVQHTRLDSRQAENALLSTIAYSEP